jgi:desulfoferrodoxin (superoxide reductase-like protein)
MKKMALGRLLVIFVSALFVLGMSHPALAHNPEKVDIAYDFNTQTLIVKITHPSNTPDRHYVREVVVKKNGQVVQRGEYTKQAGDTFTYTYKMAVTGADTIEVTAVCSIHGSTTQKFNPGV